MFSLHRRINPLIKRRAFAEQSAGFLALCLLAASLLLGSVTACQASTTNVTATVTAPDGQLYANGAFKAELYHPGTPSTQIFVNGVLMPISAQSASGALGSLGDFAVTLTDNISIAPAGTKWRFTICSNTTAACFNSIQLVTGAASNLSVALSADASVPVVSSVVIPRTYRDSEVQPAIKGSFYYNVPNAELRIFDGSSFQPITTPVNWAAPGSIGSTTANTGRFTDITTSAPLVDPRFYGAICNSVETAPIAAINSAAFQALIAAQGVLKRIQLPNTGLCYLGTHTLSLAGGFSIQGTGQGMRGGGGWGALANSGLSFAIDTPGLSCINLTCSSIELRSFEIKGGGGTNVAAHGVYAGGNFIYGEGISVHNFAGHGVNITGGCVTDCADSFYFVHSDASQNGLNGWNVVGDDTNAGKLVQDSAYNNGGCGFFIQAFLGSTFDTNLSFGNTLGGYCGNISNTASTLITPYIESNGPQVPTGNVVQVGGAPIAPFSVGTNYPNFGFPTVAVPRVYNFVSDTDVSGLTTNLAAGHTADQDIYEHLTKYNDPVTVYQTKYWHAANKSISLCEGNGATLCEGQQNTFFYHSNITGDTMVSATGGGIIYLNNLAGSGGVQVRDGVGATVAIAFNGGANAKPTCDSTKRMYLWTVAGAVGVADTVEICTKDAANAYAWRALF